MNFRRDVFFEWLRDYRTWLFLLVWCALRILDYFGNGDFTQHMTRAESIGALVILSFSVWLFLWGAVDYAFLPDDDWNEMWKSGDGWTKLSIAVMHLAIAVLAGNIAGRIINPFS